MTDQILDRLMRLHPKLIDLGLERTQRLLAAVGSPHLKLPPVVHVAGTNGKGSLVAYLRAMAEAAGYRVHVYTSPHLVRFNERIRVAGHLIDDDFFDAVLTECEQANQEEPITFFEITTVAAYLAFSRVPADLTVIEVGMGGRYDATNVIDPVLSAITPIGYDHTGFLGDKLEGIAAEKAGILKHAVPAVIGRQREASAQVIADAAAKLAVPLFRMGREWQVTPTSGGFRYDSDLLGLDLPAPALVGAHQIDNAATAVACIERLRAAQFRIDDAAIARGLVVGRVAGPPAEAVARAAGRGHAARRRALAGWRSQRGLRHRARASGRRVGQGAGAAAALPDLRHAHDQGRRGFPAASRAPRPQRARRADRRSCRLYAAGILRTGGRGRPGLRAHKRHRRGAGRPVGHPARADAYPDLRVALCRGPGPGPQRLTLRDTALRAAPQGRTPSC